MRYSRKPTIVARFANTPEHSPASTVNKEQRVPTAGKKNGIISKRVHEQVVILGPQEADLIP